MKKFTLIPILVFFAILVPSKEIAFAEGGIAWTGYYPQGVPICTEFTTEQNIRMAPDGSGGAIIVWEDFRGPDANIYAQRIDENGVAQWGQNGVGVCNVPFNQFLPVIVGDGDGGAIIAWEDYRDPAPNIYAVRIDGNTGDPYTGWPSTGVVLGPTTEFQIDPDIVSDDSGGAIITWQQENWIWAHRIKGDGTPGWGWVLPVSSGTTVVKQRPKIINDGTGYVIITWQEWQSGVYDIYAQRVSISTGTVEWGIYGNPVSQADDNQREPEIVSDGSGGAIITWTDERNTTTAPDIYAQRIDSNGAQLWTTDGIPICKYEMAQSSPVITSHFIDGAIAGAIIAWEDRRIDPNGDIYAGRVGLDGDVDGDDIVREGNQMQICPRLVSDNQEGGTIVTWIEYDGSSFKIFAHKRDQDGQPVWSSYPGVLVCEDTEIWDSQIISDGYGGAIVAWMGRGVGFDYDIYAQRIIDDAVFGSASISGSVIRLSTEEGIAGVEVEALKDGELVSSDFTNTYGYYEITGLPPDTYMVRATWMANGIESSVSMEAYAPSDYFDFTLEIEYELGTIVGSVSGVKEKYIASLSRVESKRISGSGLQKSLSPGNGIAFVELEQRDKVIVRVPVEMDGNYSIPNLLPGRFIARAYNGTIYSNPRMVNLKEGETFKVNFVFGIMPGEEVYNYPNPAKSGSTRIRYYCGYSDPEAEIRIYNIAGELVRKVRDSEIEEAGAFVYKFLWNCKNNSGKEVASGVYIYIVDVKDKGGSGSKKVIKRMAVIR